MEARVEAVERSFRYRPMLRVAIGDASRGTLVLRFFHFNRAQLALFVPGRRILCYGEARPGQHGLEMVHPSYRLLGDDADAGVRDRLDPVYPAVEGLGPQTLSRLIGEALQRLPPAEDLELLPAGLRERLGLPTLREALDLNLDDSRHLRFEQAMEQQNLIKTIEEFGAERGTHALHHLLAHGA